MTIRTRWPKRIAECLAITIGFVTACVLGLWLHLNHAAARGVIRASVNQALASALAGKVVIETLGAIGSRGIDGLDLRVEDPHGTRVLSVHGAHIRIAVLSTLRNLLLVRGPLRLRIDGLRVDDVVAVLNDDDRGRLGIAQAFASRTRSASSSQSSGGLELELWNVEFAHALVRAELHGVPAFRADVDALQGSLSLGPAELVIAIRQFALATRELPYGGDLRGDGVGHMTIPLQDDRKMALHVGWHGSVEAGSTNSPHDSSRGPAASVQRDVHAVGVTLEAGIEGDAVEAVLSVPRITPEDARGIWPAWPLERETSVRAEIRGTLPSLDVRTHVALGASSLEMSGTAHWGAEKSVDARLAVNALDARSFSGQAPESRIDAQGDVRVVLAADGSVRAETMLEISEHSRVEAWPLPAMTIRASAVGDARNGLIADATVHADEAGLPLELTGHMVLEEGSPVLTFDGNARARRLGDVTRLHTLMQGNAARRGRQSTAPNAELLGGRVRFETHGIIDARQGRIDANLGLEAEDLHRGDVRADSLSLRGRITGSLDAPVLDVALGAHGLDLATVRWSEARAELHGHPTSASFAASALCEDGSRWRADATLNQGSPLGLRNVRVSFERGTDRLLASSQQVDIVGADIDVRDLVITGFDAPVRASLSTTGGVLRIRARTTDLDVAQAGRLVGKSFMRGHAAFDVDLALTSKTANGHVTLDLERGEIGPASDVTAHVDATLKDRSIAARVDAKLGQGAWIHLQADSLTAAGNQPVLASLPRLWGDLRVESEIDLGKLDPALDGYVERLLAGSGIALAPNQGTLAVVGRMSRGPTGEEMPGLELLVRATHLSVPAANDPSSRGSSSSSSREPVSREIEANLVVEVEEGTGSTRIAADVTDTAAQLAMLEWSATSVPYESIIADPTRSWTLLQTVPFKLRLAIPRRSIETFPGALLPKTYRGELEAILEATGTLREPSVDVMASIARGRIFGVGLGTPLDALVHAHYDGTKAEGKLTIRMRDKDVATARARITIPALDLLANDGSRAVRWEASSEVQLVAFPLDTLRALEDRQVRGTLSGELVLEGLHRDGRAKLTMAGTDLRVRDTAYGSANLQLTVAEGKLNALLRFEHDKSSAEARVDAGARWGSDVSPTLDSSRPLTASVVAQRFPLGILLPLLDETLVDLDGDIDADAKVRLDPRGPTVTTEGTAVIANGSFDMAGSRGGLHGISGKITFSPNGVVRVDDLTAHGTSGDVHASGSARFDLFGLAEARGHVEIPSSNPLPLTVEGAGYGTIDGDLDWSVARSADRKRLHVQADVARLRVQLPATSTRSLQALGPVENLKLGSSNADPEPSPAPTAPGTRSAAVASSGGGMSPRASPSDQVEIQITVRLGKDVEIRRGNTFVVALSGAPTITVRDTLEVAGQISVLHGVIDVRGKSFDIEEGTITFVGNDSLNPQIVMSAGWSAPDGTKVHAHFVGPLKTGKVTLSSEPQLPKNDILALLLFGTADGARANAAQTSTLGSSSAAGLAGNTAAQPLNRALQDFGLGGVSTRVDSSSTNPRPEVEVQIARDISLQVAWVLGATTPGSRPDRTLFTLDWRFVRRWSLQTTIGDAGTSILDLVWQFRY